MARKKQQKNATAMKKTKSNKMTKSKKEEDTLQKIYYDTRHSAAYGSVQNLVKASGLSKRVVERWLRSQPTYTLHKTRRLRFPMARYYVRKPNLQFQSDLVDYSKFASHNKGYKYMLMIMDLFTRQAWAFPLKTKSGKEVASIFQPFFRQHPTERLQCDEGKEFYNKDVKQVLADYGIELFSIYSATKAALVERLNRTIKGMLEKIFTATNSKNWIDVIDDVMHIYNNRK
ncbi:MAG: DDE-type integrase/transposase/recombinase, partial [Cyanobacteria bacterium J06553_1]